MEFQPKDNFWILKADLFPILNFHDVSADPDCLLLSLGVKRLYTNKLDKIGLRSSDYFYLWSSFNEVKRAYVKFVPLEKDKFTIYYASNSVDVQASLEKYFETFLVL